MDEIWYRARLLLRGKPIPGRPRENVRPHPFDAAYGVDTGGLVWGEGLEDAPRGEAEYWATGYYGISPSAFTQALEQLNLDWNKFTFVDVGCGKGRALLLALRYPFRQVLGIELSPGLARIASANLQRFEADWRRPETHAEVMAGDATQIPVPSGPLMLFLYHPFAAPVMKQFLTHILRAAQSEERDMYVLYANPELAGMVGGTPGAQLLWKSVFSLTAEEGAADRFGSYGEVFAAYRLSKP